MAGDWIPMRTNLRDDPTVAFIARSTKLQADHVVGKLHHLWAWADSHTIDGILADIDADWIDEYVGKRGFAAAMAGANRPWLEITGDSVRIPNFENWFGASAKRRMADTKRKQTVRALSATCPQDERTKTGLQNSTEEKRRVLAPAQSAVDWESAISKAREIAAKLGPCKSERNKRMVLGACAIAQVESLESWLDTAVRETVAAHPQNHYAYLHTILDSGARDFDFKASIAAIELPTQQSRPLEAPTC